MNEDLQNVIQTAAVSLIEKAMSGVDSATDFLQAEIPDYVHQLMLWYGVKSGVISIFCLIVLWLWVKYLIVKPIKIAREGLREKKASLFVDKYGMLEPRCMMGIFHVFIIIPIGEFTQNSMEALQIWIAPKVWLMEYAATLVK